MNYKADERIVILMTNHLEIWRSAEKRNEHIIKYNENLVKYADALKAFGSDITAAHNDEEEMTEEEITINNDYVNRVDKFTTYSDKVFAAGNKYQKTVQLIQSVYKEFEQLRTRLDMQKLDNSHSQKLIDKLEQSALKSKNDTEEYFVTLALFETELAEMKIGMEHYLN